MSKVLHKKRRMIFCFIALILLLALAVTIMIYSAVRSHLEELCRYKCAEIVNNILADAMFDLPSEELYTVSRNSEGHILSVDANSRALNSLQAELRQYVNNTLSGSGYDNIALTLGDLTDIAFFSGRGADINIRYQQSGIADTRVESSFSDAGINQTRLKVSIVLSVSFTAFLPDENENITIEAEYIAADKIIVGEVPQVMYNDIAGT